MGAEFACDFFCADGLFFRRKRVEITDCKHLSVKTGQKGLLSVKRCGAANEYTAVISESAYEQAGAREVIDRLYNGSVKNMIASLADCGAISDEEMDELKNWFSKR